MALCDIHCAQIPREIVNICKQRTMDLRQRSERSWRHLIQRTAFKKRQRFLLADAFFCTRQLL